MKKGCLYWIFIGWWLELYKWFFKAMYWIFIGWWRKLLLIIKEKRELNSISRDLYRISSDLNNIESQIDTMAENYANTPNNISFDSMEGHQFEYFCADVLKSNGFENVEVTQGSGDHGIDILAEKDGITYAIQCKCYSSNIGNAAVQQAYTGKGFYHKDIAVVLTNRYFTTQAKEEAQTLGVKLWDRDKLNSLIEKAQ